MHSRAHCVLLAVGTELTEGRIQDAHLQYIGGELARVGVPLSRCVHIPDDRDSFARELRSCVSEADAVIVTGGLGPTSDDLTREVVAQSAGVELVYHPEVWDEIEKRFAGRPPAQANRRQCYTPSGFSLMPNPHGTAPGFSGAMGTARVFALPGPPRELVPMFRDAVLPMLTSVFGLIAPEEIQGSAHLIGESALEDALKRCAVGGVSWGTRIADDRIAFTLRGGGPADREAFFGAIQRLVGEMHIRRGDRGAAEVLYDSLRSAGSRIATAESCTGGLVGAWLTDIPGSSSVYSGGVIAYADAVKVRMLGVADEAIERHGAVSEEVVLQMARGVMLPTDADYGVAVSGIAGPAGGTPQKPVGTVWIAVAARAGGGHAECFHFAGSRGAVRRRSASAACIMAECLVAGRAWEPYGR